jgi:hypothetical protein
MPLGQGFGDALPLSVGLALDRLPDACDRRTCTFGDYLQNVLWCDRTSLGRLLREFVAEPGQVLALRSLLFRPLAGFFKLEVSDGAFHCAGDASDSLSQGDQFR